jgi:hypothetical protein
MAHLVHIGAAVLRDHSVRRRLTATGARVRELLVCNRLTQSAANWCPPTQRYFVADSIIAMGRGASIPS